MWRTHTVPLEACVKLRVEQRAPDCIVCCYMDLQGMVCAYRLSQVCDTARRPGHRQGIGAGGRRSLCSPLIDGLELGPGSVYTFGICVELAAPLPLTCVYVAHGGQLADTAPAHAVF